MKNFFKPNGAMIAGVATGSFLMPAILPSTTVPYLMGVAMTFGTAVGIVYFIYGVVCAFSSD